MKQVQAIARMLRVSPYKLNDVACLIRGKRARDALMILQGCRKRIAVDVFKTLESALANGENNAGLDVDLLYVQEASVGKDKVRLKRMDFKGRSRSGRIIKQFSRLRVVLHERAA